MVNSTQLEIVKLKLERDGFITRNECLQKYISRLGALIYRLKKQGYEFETEYVETQRGKDYKYIATKIPNSEKAILQTSLTKRTIMKRALR